MVKEQRSIKVDKEVHEHLILIQSLLQIKYRRRVSLNDVVRWMLSQLPTLKVEVEEPLYVSEEEIYEEKDKEKVGELSWKRKRRT